MTTLSIAELLNRFRPKIQEYNRRFDWHEEADKYVPAFVYMSPGFIFAKFEFFSRCLDGKSVFSSRRIQRAHVVSGASRVATLGSSSRWDERRHGGREET